MGHERIGYLPKTKKWAAVVADIQSYSASNSTQIAEISKKTLKNVAYKFEDIIGDSGVQSALEYLLLLTIIPKRKNWQDYLSKKGILLDEHFSLLNVVNNAKKHIEKYENSKEYASVAQQALSDSISKWTTSQRQGNMFASHLSHPEIWREASNGKGFCELSRLFFSNFTERYLKYFLDREAYGKINNLETLNNFSLSIKNEVDHISTFAFESSKITESFAAGWYNKHVKGSLPSHETIKSFVDYSFKKLNSEFLIERRSE